MRELPGCADNIASCAANLLADDRRKRADDAANKTCRHQYSVLLLSLLLALLGHLRSRAERDQMRELPGCADNIASCATDRSTNEWRKRADDAAKQTLRHQYSVLLLSLLLALLGHLRPRTERDQMRELPGRADNIASCATDRSTNEWRKCADNAAKKTLRHQYSVLSLLLALLGHLRPRTERDQMRELPGCADNVARCATDRSANEWRKRADDAAKKTLRHQYSILLLNLLLALLGHLRPRTERDQMRELPGCADNVASCAADRSADDRRKRADDAAKKTCRHQYSVLLLSLRWLKGSRSAVRHISLLYEK